MKQMNKHGQLGKAARQANMDRKTARKYVDGLVPEPAPAGSRTYKTRSSPFEGYFDEIEGILRASPGIEAKTIFELLCEKYDGTFQPNQVRTLQRWVHQWHVRNDLHKTVMFPQRHRPGEAAQTDFTSTSELKVTIQGELYAHLLCVFVLPFSNWMWATVVLSESLAAIQKGVQAALFQLQHVPTFHQTDNSTAATHLRGEGDTANDSIEAVRERPFNHRYLALMRHYSMTPRTIAVGESEQNGDVESMNGSVKRRLDQELIVRGSRDFDSVQEWQKFIHRVVRKMNLSRKQRFEEECVVMRKLTVEQLQEFTEERVRVSQASTIRVRQHAYSVPSRLIGEELSVRIFEGHIEAFYRGEKQLECDRSANRESNINYRHVVESLLRKPGAFERYVYREHMFPSIVFRKAYDALSTRLSGVRRDVAYLRILHLAAMTSERDVEAALELLLSAKDAISVTAVKELADSRAKVSAPDMLPMSPQLKDYDVLVRAAS